MTVRVCWGVGSRGLFVIIDSVVNCAVQLPTSRKVATRNWGSAEATGAVSMYICLKPGFTLLVCWGSGGLSGLACVDLKLVGSGSGWATTSVLHMVWAGCPSGQWSSS